MTSQKQMTIREFTVEIIDQNDSMKSSIHLILMLLNF